MTMPNMARLLCSISMVVSSWRLRLKPVRDRATSACSAAVLVSLFASGVSVASAQNGDNACFDYVITVFPFDQELINGRAAETPVSWCSEVDSETGQRGLASFHTSCSGRGYWYIDCSTDGGDFEFGAESFTFYTEQVFCQLLASGGCFWEVYYARVQFDASGGVTPLEAGVKTALSGPPTLF